MYGELVIPFDNVENENHSTVHGEVEAMEEHIRMMIEEAAYFLSEKRGFKPGHELEDWLKAKAQILKQL